MADDVSPVQSLHRKLTDAAEQLARHVAAHPEIEFSHEHIRLFSACQELERQLERLDNRIRHTP